MRIGVNPACMRDATEFVFVRSRIINWEDRHTGPNALWNHCAHFDSIHTVIWDGYPSAVWKPSKWDATADKFGARDLKSGKYNCCVFKFHVCIGFHGLIVAHTGPHFGVPHDHSMWIEDAKQFPMKPGKHTTCSCKF
jgi:hypothetical protein